MITINKILTIYSCNLLLHSNNELKAVEDRSDPEHEERATLANVQTIEIIEVKPQVVALQEALNGAETELKAIQHHGEAERMELSAAANEAERPLSESESELTKLNGELDDQSKLANVQEIESIAAETQVEALKQALDGTSAELKAIEDYQTAELIELKSANEELIKERGEFETFRRRVGEIVEQLVAQTAEDNMRARDLENRLIEHSRQLDERELELRHLRDEMEIALKAEADLRRNIIEIEGRAHIVIQDLKAEAAKLQAALDRANGERVRLAHELARSKRQAE